MSRVLVTGGAGFIGKHVCRRLKPPVAKAVIYDSFVPVVHGVVMQKDIRDLEKLLDAEVFTGDVTDGKALGKAMHGCDSVIHLAAGVSVSASQFEPSRFVKTNSLGTAVLWEEILKHSNIQHVTIASSDVGLWGG